MKRLLICMVVLSLMVGCAVAEDNVWALCKSYVNLRAKPSKNAQIVGYLDCGDGVETDWKVKNGWLHIISPLESSDAWVNVAFVVDSKPEKSDKKMTVVSSGRVALRTAVNGKRRAWVNDGDVLTVLWISDEWALTNRGYIKAEYLEVE